MGAAVGTVLQLWWFWERGFAAEKSQWDGGAGVSWKDSPLTIPQEAAREGNSDTWRPPPSPVPPRSLIT